MEPRKAIHAGNIMKAQAPYGLTTLTYDERNLPLTVATGGVTTSYRYSDGGQRYWKKTGTNAGEYYALDGAVTVGVFSDAGALKHWNILAGGAVVGRSESGAKRYYHRDHLGTTRVVVDASGIVKEARDYYPFGLAMPGRTTLTGTGAREGFTGKERDAETGLDYFGARYYMAVLGRWGNVDPLAEKYAGWSPYNYVMGNPLALVDPDGMAPLGASSGCPPNCDFRSVVGGFFNFSVSQVENQVNAAVYAATQSDWHR